MNPLKVYEGNTNTQYKVRHLQCWNDKFKPETKESICSVTWFKIAPIITYNSEMKSNEDDFLIAL